MSRLSAPVAPLVLVALGAAALLSWSVLDRLSFSHDSRSLLRADPAAAAAQRELVRRFGSEDILLVAWEAGDAADPAEFERVRALTAALAGIPGLQEVYSLASPRVLLPLGPGGLLRPIEPRDLAMPDGRARVREALRAAPVYAGTIYSPDLEVVAVAGTLEPRPGTLRAATLREVRRVARRFERDGRPIHVAGVTALAVDAARAALGDLRRIGTLALLAALAILFVLCRSLRETVVAVLVTGLPPLYALGLACALDLPMTALGAALFPVLAVVGITSSVHLLHAYAAGLRAGEPPGRAAWGAARRLAPPITLSLLTTACAFVALQATGVPAFHTGGRVVALGLLCAIPVVLVGLPSLLVLVRPRPRQRGSRAMRRLLLRTGLLALRRPRLVVGAALVVGILAAAAAARAPLRVDVLQAFRPDSAIARTYRFLDERLTATLPVDVVLSARPGASASGVIEDLQRFGERVEALPGVDSALSAATLVRYGRTVAPIDPGDAGALVFLRATLPEILRRFEHRSSDSYRVKVRVREGTPPEVLDGIERAAAGMTTGDATVQGLFVRAVATTRALRADLARGVLLMAALVAVVTALALRSVRDGAAALFVNLIPPAVVFGFAAAAGLPLDIGAVAVGGVAVGLAVDDTLHLVFRVARERRAGRGGRRAVLAAVAGVGRALAGSTLVLVAGLGSLAASAFLPTARFGLFAAAACAVALVADLLVLPAMLARARDRD